MTDADIKYYIETGSLPPIHKPMKTAGSMCECGQLLTYKVSPYMTTEKRVCPKCGAVHYVDYSPIEFGKVFER